MRSLKPWQNELIDKNILSMSPKELAAKTGASMWAIYQRLKAVRAIQEKRTVSRRRPRAQYSNSNNASKYFD